MLMHKNSENPTKFHTKPKQTHDQSRVIILGVSKNVFFFSNGEVQFVRFESFPRFAHIKCLFSSSSDLTTMLEASDDAMELISKVGERIKRNIFSF